MKANKIQLICVGQLKFKGLKEVAQNYCEKINFFTKFGISRLKDIKDHDDESKKKREGRMMLKLLDKQDIVIALDEHGKKMDSLEFAAFLAHQMDHHPHRLVFLLGGHAGLSPLLAPHVRLKLSFSPMTFGHDVFRVLFLEQLYRAFTIIKGIKYHR